MSNFTNMIKSAINIYPYKHRSYFTYISKNNK